MTRLFAIVLMIFGFACSASADVWRWVDVDGESHFVDSNRPIYTWVDQYNKAYYSDKPGHEDAVQVQLMWHSSGTLADIESNESEQATDEEAYPGEPAEERLARQAAQAHNCERANQILDSYLNAPQLYRTDAVGEREILSDAEMAATIADAKSKTNELCRQ